MSVSGSNGNKFSTFPIGSKTYSNIKFQTYTATYDWRYLEEAPVLIATDGDWSCFANVAYKTTALGKIVIRLYASLNYNGSPIPANVYFTGQVKLSNLQMHYNPDILQLDFPE